MYTIVMFKDFQVTNARVQYYSKCIDLAKDIPDVLALAYSNRSQCQLKLKLYRKAEKDATEALKAQPKHVKSLVRRASARKHIGKLKEAHQGLFCRSCPIDAFRKTIISVRLTLLVLSRPRTSTSPRSYKFIDPKAFVDCSF